MFRLFIDTEGFPLGKGPMVMLVLFLISTLFIFGRSEEAGEELEFWIFANTHYEEYQARVPIFEAENPGVNVRPHQFRWHDARQAPRCDAIQLWCAGSR